MRKVALSSVLLCAVMACGEDDPVSGDPAGCAEGSYRCQGTVVERCSGGSYVAEQDCAETGGSCELAGSGVAECVDDGDCTAGDSRCVAGTLERCSEGLWQPETVCPDAGQVCREHEDGAACEALGWTLLPVTIDDPVVTGTSLMVPIDTISFAFDAAGTSFITAFDRDLSEPTDTFLWHLDGSSGTHAKRPLSGTVFSEAENFCVGEPWCQFIGFDPDSAEWVVLGPATSGMMRVSSSWQGSITAVSGPQPPESYLNHSYRFAWSARRLFLYGAIGPSAFSDTVYSFDLDTAEWSEALSGLPQIDDNCIAYDPDDNSLYSIAGRVTTDGGNTSQTQDRYAMIHLSSATVDEADLPAAIGPRRALSCAFDPTRRLLYVFGGAVVNDYWDEAENEYHNDLWVLDVVQGSWTAIVPDTESGTLLPPDSYGDQSFEGYPDGPNFGQNRGYLQYDAANDRLVIIGAVPVFTHEQIYFLDLQGVEQLL